MSVHKPVKEPGIYFITFTCHRWLPLIQQTNSYDLIYNWFDILKANGHFINAYVIMPNHLHFLLYYNGGEQSLNTIIGNGKRFLAYDLVHRMEQQGHHALLKNLQRDVRDKDRSRGKKHEVWKNSFDVKECRTEPFIMQKLNYIHNNPCSGKWKLAAEPLGYPYSSACSYMSNKKGLYAIKDYREFLSFEDGW